MSYPPVEKRVWLDSRQKAEPRRINEAAALWDRASAEPDRFLPA
jgi:hypothetical protein